jgi:hypothetical protein
MEGTAGDDRVSWKSRGGGNSIKRSSDCFAIALIALPGLLRRACAGSGPYHPPALSRWPHRGRRRSKRNRKDCPDFGWLSLVGNLRGLVRFEAFGLKTISLQKAGRSRVAMYTACSPRPVEDYGSAFSPVAADNTLVDRDGGMWMLSSEGVARIASPERLTEKTLPPTSNLIRPCTRRDGLTMEGEQTIAVLSLAGLALRGPAGVVLCAH